MSDKTNIFNDVYSRRRRCVSRNRNRARAVWTCEDLLLLFACRLRPRNFFIQRNRDRINRIVLCRARPYEICFSYFFPLPKNSDLKVVAVRETACCPIARVSRYSRVVSNDDVEESRGSVDAVATAGER